MFRFESPRMLILLALAPLFVGAGLISLKYYSIKLKKVYSERVLPFLTKSISQRKRRWKIFLQGLCLALMVLSLARPQLGSSKSEVRSEGVEIILAVDVSTSMLAEDVKPSRLEQAKLELSKLVDLMPGNKVAIIGFAGSAALLSPLTSDPSAVKMYIDSLSPASVSTGGTCFQCALDLAKESFEKGGVAADDTVAVTRVVLIASDGEDHEKGALDAAKELSDKGIRIFSLAYGTEKGGAIPERDQFGYLKGYKKDSSGQTILSVVKGDALMELAKAGKGSFYFSTAGGANIQELVKDLNRLEKAQFATSVVTQYNERYQWVLALAFLVGLFELFIGDRRSRFVMWKGRFEVPPA